jgi:hypothetical protein
MRCKYWACDRSEPKTIWWGGYWFNFQKEQYSLGFYIRNKICSFGC